VIVF